MALTIQYFAILREQAGRDVEALEFSAGQTPAVLYEELRARHHFTLTPELLRVAVNDEFVAWDYPLQPGDRVVLIPPVAGG